jgi:Cu+-exporting ATPase
MTAKHPRHATLPTPLQLPGVLSVTVNLATNSAAVAYDPALTGPRACLAAIEAAGFDAAPIAPDDPSGEGGAAAAAAAREVARWRRRLLVSAALSVPLAVLAMLSMAPGLAEKLEGPPLQPHGGHRMGHAGMNAETAASAVGSSGSGSGPRPGKLVGGLPILWLVQLLMAGAVQFGVGWTFYSSAWHSLRSRRPNMAVLVVLGTSAAFVYSVIAMGLAATQPAFMGHVYFESRWGWGGWW